MQPFYCRYSVSCHLALCHTSAMPRRCLIILKVDTFAEYIQAPLVIVGLFSNIVICDALWVMAAMADSSFVVKETVPYYFVHLRATLYQ